MSNMGFKAFPLFKAEKEQRDYKIVCVKQGDTESFIFTTQNPRQYIQVSGRDIDRIREDITGQGLQAATARRAEQNGSR